MVDEEIDKDELEFLKKALADETGGKRDRKEKK